ncbi:MAG: hypothetical protein JKY15_02890 [Deltaproteobacteria bacterium]|nr:hypothetical protein [Deltaproteobacteria bacterium]
MEVDGTLLIQMALFLGLLGFLSKFLFTPMITLFEERERRIEGARQETIVLQRQAQKNLDEIERRVHEAQREAKQALLELKAEGARFHREVLDKAREDCMQRLRQSQEELRLETERLRKELVPVQLELASLVLGKIVPKADLKIQMEPSHA